MHERWLMEQLSHGTHLRPYSKVIKVMSKAKYIMKLGLKGLTRKPAETVLSIGYSALLSFIVLTFMLITTPPYNAATYQILDQADFHLRVAPLDLESPSLTPANSIIQYFKENNYDFTAFQIYASSFVQVTVDDENGNGTVITAKPAIFLDQATLEALKNRALQVEGNVTLDENHTMLLIKKETSATTNGKIGDTVLLSLAPNAKNATKNSVVNATITGTLTLKEKITGPQGTDLISTTLNGYFDSILQSKYFFGFDDEIYVLPLQALLAHYPQESLSSFQWNLLIKINPESLMQASTNPRDEFNALETRLQFEFSSIFVEVPITTPLEQITTIHDQLKSSVSIMLIPLLIFGIFVFSLVTDVKRESLQKEGKILQVNGVRKLHVLLGRWMELSLESIAGVLVGIVFFSAWVALYSAPTAMFDTGFLRGGADNQVIMTLNAFYLPFLVSLAVLFLSRQDVLTGKDLTRQHSDEREHASSLLVRHQRSGTLIFLSALILLFFFSSQKMTGHPSFDQTMTLVGILMVIMTWIGMFLMLGPLWFAVIQKIHHGVSRRVLRGSNLFLSRSDKWKREVIHMVLLVTVLSSMWVVGVSIGMTVEQQRDENYRFSVGSDVMIVTKPVSTSYQQNLSALDVISAATPLSTISGMLGSFQLILIGIDLQSFKSVAYWPTTMADQARVLEDSLEESKVVMTSDVKESLSLQENYELNLIISRKQVSVTLGGFVDGIPGLTKLKEVLNLSESYTYFVIVPLNLLRQTIGYDASQLFLATLSKTASQRSSGDVEQVLTDHLSSTVKQVLFSTDVPRTSNLLIGVATFLAVISTALVMVVIISNWSSILKDRRQAIGITLVSGTTRKELQRLLLTESTLVMTLGLLTGLVLGFLTSIEWVILSNMSFPEKYLGIVRYHLTVSWSIIGVVIPIGIVLVLMILYSYRTVNMNPIIKLLQGEDVEW